MHLNRSADDLSCDLVDVHIRLTCLDYQCWKLE